MLSNPHSDNAFKLLRDILTNSTPKSSLISAGIVYLSHYLIRSIRPGVVVNVQIDFGVSELFSYEEIRSAMEMIKSSFVNNRTGWDELVELWYDERKSSREVKRRDKCKDNTIVLLSYQYVGRGFDNRIKRHITPWFWVLSRNNPYESWVIISGGKTL